MRARLADIGAEMLTEALEQLRDGTARPQPQDDALATHAPRLTREMGDVDWTLPSKTIYDHYRACVPWPGTFTHLPDGTRLRIIECRRVMDAPANDPGGVHVEGRRLLVGAGDGAIELLTVQPESRAPMAAEAYLNGLRGCVPERFHSLKDTGRDKTG